MKEVLEKIKNNKKIVSIMLYTVISLFIINFIVLPTSHSKFFKKGELSFATEFYKLTNGEKIIVSREEEFSSLNNLAISFTVKRNQITEANFSDIYRVEIPSSCKILSVNGKETNSHTITYAGSSENTNESILVYLICNLESEEESVVDENGFINVPIKIYEHVENKNVKEPEFLYKESLFPAGGSLTKDEFNSTYDVKPTVELEFKISKTDNKIWDKIKEKVDTYIDIDVKEKYSNLQDPDLFNRISNAINNYISYYQNVDNDKSLLRSINGFKVDQESDNENYIFKIEENFVGYARTAAEFKNKRYMFFSTLENDIVKLAFDNYIREMFPDDIEFINEYIAKYTDDIGDYILNGNIRTGQGVIPGLKRIANDSEIIDLLNLMSYVKSKSPIKVQNQVKGQMVYYFNNELDVQYSNTVSESIRTLLKKDGVVRTSVTKNSGTPALKNIFDDYFIIFDSEKQNYLIINISSDPTNEEKGDFTYVNIFIVSFENVNIVFEPDVESSAKLSKITLSMLNTAENKIELVNTMNTILNSLGITEEVSEQNVQEINGNIILEYNLVDKLVTWIPNN